MQRRIINKESFSAGKTEGHNDDNIYIGKDFAAVIDGVSNKSSVLVNGKKIKIAQIITEAIRKMDRPGAPVYAKTLSFDECVRFINLYIQEYLQRNEMDEQVGKMEATGAIYSRFHNQIWIVGDCKAIYDGKVIQNPLKIDEVVVDLRAKIIEVLMKEGYTDEQIMQTDISIEIIKKPESLYKYIKSDELREQLEAYRNYRIKCALLECGFSEAEIEAQNLIKKYYNPRNLQQLLKNNPNMGTFGYAVFNGKYTETKNCKVVNLPENVKTIKLFSDGFPVDALNNNKDVGYAVRKIRKKAAKDPLSIGINRAVQTSKRYSKKENRRAIDDASVVIIEIARDEKEQDERG